MPENEMQEEPVLTTRDPIESIRHFNKLAGNTDDVYNVRQAALYFGLQAEELAEKFFTIGLEQVGRTLDILGLELKTGVYDERIKFANRKNLLDDDADLFVVTVGSMLSQGADVVGALNEVCRANDSKIFPDGAMHRNEHGKIIKPDTFTPPDLSPFVCKD
jgi:predicted HAD superfamily Cof-like phosphohydrolase